MECQGTVRGAEIKTENVGSKGIWGKMWSARERERDRRGISLCKEKQAAIFASGPVIATFFWQVSGIRTN